MISNYTELETQQKNRACGGLSVLQRKIQQLDLKSLLVTTYYKGNFILQVLQMKDLRFRDGTNGIFAYKIAPQAIFQFQDAANGFYLAK